MRTPAPQAKQNDLRYRWASRHDNVSAPQSRHNRQPKSNAPPSAAKKGARVRVLAGFTHPSWSLATQMTWLVEVSKTPKHLYLERPARPEHLRVATHCRGRMGWGEDKILQNSSAGTFFAWDMYFKRFQSKMELRSVCI